MRQLGVIALIAVSYTAAAGDIRSVDWAWNVDDPEMFYAVTTNSAGHLLGQYCYLDSGNCLYLVGFDVTCDEGDKYVALVNSDIAAKSLEFVCGKRFEGQNLMVASDFESVDKIVREASKVGFALPMQGDSFKAIRFSLLGSNEALDSMRTASAAAMAKKKVPNKSDIRPAVERL